MLSELMASKKPRAEGKRVLIWALLGIFLSVFWWLASSMSISAVRIKGPQGSLKRTILPYYAPKKSGHVLEFTMKVHKHMLTRERVRIIPDDHFQSLSLNGHVLPLKGFVRGRLNDWRGGFSYPLRRFMNSGENTLVLKIRNKQGLGGVDVYTDFLNSQSLCVLTLGLFCLICALGAPLRQWGMGWKIRGVIFAGLWVWWVYSLITPWDYVRSYDVGGHVAHVKYVLEHWSPPHSLSGGEFYQPPLYYFSAAAFWSFLAFFGLQRSYILEALQLQSLAYVFGFVIFSFMTFRLAAQGLSRDKERVSGKGTGELLLWTGLLIFWPSVVIHSARIGNDSLFYFLSAATFYFVMKWWVSGRIDYFRWASVFAALDVLNKANGLILFFLMGFLFFVRWFSGESRGWRLFVQKTWLVWVTFAGAVLFTCAGGLLGSQPDAQLMVDNNLKTFLGFDAKIFFKEPYTSSTNDLQGRLYFWNYLLKTSLFGEFSFSNKGFVPLLARGLSCGLIFIIFFPLVGLLGRRKQWPRLPGDFPMAVSLVLFLASIILFRIYGPFSCAGDFRYILPVLAPVLYFYCTAIDKYRALGWRWVSWLGVFVGWGFVVSSGFFMLSLAL